MTSLIPTLAAALLSAASGAAAGAPASPAESPPTEFAACYAHGDVRAKPGVTLEPRRVVFTFKIGLNNCVSSDPTIRSATVRARGVGESVSCLIPGRFSGTEKVRWNNGRRSKIVFDGATIGPSGPIIGTVVRGQFRGLTNVAYGVLLADPRDCGDSDGLTRSPIVGPDLFGGSIPESGTAG